MSYIKNDIMQINVQKKIQKTYFRYNNHHIDFYSNYESFSSFKKFLIYSVFLLFNLDYLITHLCPY